jgi:hypothetical protein
MILSHLQFQQKRIVIGLLLAALKVETVMTPILKALNTPCFADVPLFTPTSADLFFSPTPVFRCPVSVFISSQMGNPISPSVLEFMKGLPEY